ncbi:MAG: acetyl esterase/lipase [Hyphomicrobiaceae bacterium]
MQETIQKQDVPIRRSLRALGSRLLPRVDGLALLDHLTPHYGYSCRQDVAYGEGGHETLDLYEPEGSNGQHPTVVFLHGGRWSFGDKRSYRFVGHAFAAAGIATAIVRYRLWPDTRFPGFVEDAARAFAFLQNNQDAFGLNGDPLFLAGHSAGAHIAALLATDTPWLAEAGGKRSQIAGAIGIAGPYDFLPIVDDDLLEIFGQTEDHPRSQPVLHVDGNEPRMLLLHGRRDRTVAPRNSARLARAINTRGGNARLITYPNLDHTRILGALSNRVGKWFGPVMDDILGFIQEKP